MKVLALLLLCAVASAQVKGVKRFTCDPTLSGQEQVLPVRKRVVAFADVHGDLGALKVLLRDLAQVVKFNDAGAVEWIGGDTVVVCLGDVIDRFRPGLTVLDKGRGEGEVEGEEKKILELLNIVATKAAEKGGALVRLIGNHEMMNNLPSRSGCRGCKYATPYALEQGDYNGKGGDAGRQAWFGPGGGGAKRLACGALAIFRVGHWTFAHGGLMPELAQILADAGGISRANEVMQQTLLGIQMDQSAKDLADKLFHEKKRSGDVEPLGLMWERQQSEDKAAPDCDQTKAALETSGAVGERNHLVMGHTPQFKGVSEGSYTFRHPLVQKTDARRLTFVGPGRPVRKEKMKAGTGINFACPFDPENPSDGALWRLDVGMSRAFDDQGAFETLGQRRPSAIDIRHLTGDEYKVRVLMAAEGLPRTWAAGKPDRGAPAFLTVQGNPDTDGH